MISGKTTTQRLVILSILAFKPWLIAFLTHLLISDQSAFCVTTGECFSFIGLFDRCCSVRRTSLDLCLKESFFKFFTLDHFYPYTPKYTFNSTSHICIELIFVGIKYYTNSLVPTEAMLNHPASLDSCGSLRSNKHHLATEESSAFTCVNARILLRTSPSFSFAAGLLPPPQRALAL